LSQHKLPVVTGSVLVEPDGGTTDSKTVVEQSGSETAVTALLASLGGVTWLWNAADSLELTLTLSYEKYVVDNEILRMITRILEEIEVTDETLAVDLIDKIGLGGHFTGEQHTLDFIKKGTELFDRSRWEA